VKPPTKEEKMAISFDFADGVEGSAKIKVVGVGGSGGNAVNTMITAGLHDVEFIVANTDAQALDNSLAPTKVQLGPKFTKGLGAGGNPEMGHKAALEDVQRLNEVLDGADMVFVTAGMGGGTGTGAAPIVAQVARDLGALTVGVVTKPFSFEGPRRMRTANAGVQALMGAVDSIITIPNEKLLALGDDDITFLDAFQRADDVLLQAIQGISDLINNHGQINVDFADAKSVLSRTGRALMGTGYGKGDRRAIEAAQYAVNSPLLDDISIDGATAILINVTGGPDIKLREVSEAANFIGAAAHEDAEVYFGLVTDPDMSDVVKITVIATGFEAAVAQQSAGTAARAVRASLGYGPGHVSTTQLRAPTSSSRPSMPAVEERRSIQPQVNGARAFGASAMDDEALLEIPAYIRRASQSEIK
jgi:cell division protein FtsZ